MFYGLYDPDTGIVSQCVGGPSRDWAALMARPGELIIDSEAEIDNSQQRVNVSTYPHALINVPPSISMEELQNNIVRAAQQRLDEFARTRGYDSILSAATYAGDTIPQFAAEGRRAVELRGQTWAVLYSMLAEVQAGTKSVPASYSEIEGGLPALEW